MFQLFYPITSSSVDSSGKHNFICMSFHITYTHELYFDIQKMGDGLMLLMICISLTALKYDIYHQKCWPYFVEQNMLLYV